MKVKPCPLPLRAISVVLSVVVPLSSFPSCVWAAASPQVSPPAVQADSADAPPPAANAPSAPVKITHLPATRVTSIPSVPGFSVEPTEAEFSQVRMFEQALVPLGVPSAAENKALADALTKYFERSDREDQSALIAFLNQFPNSPWKPTLLINLGVAWRQTGYFTRAMKAWEDAWNLTKKETAFKPKSVADRAFAELVQLNAWVGRFQVIEPLLAETGERQFIGDATEMVSGARQGLWYMKNHPEQGFMCGPYALKQILTATKTDADFTKLIEAKSSGHGFNLTQVKALADQVRLKYQMAKRKPGSAIPLNSVVHWKLNHYGALLKERRGRYLIQDSTFGYKYGQELWVSRAALEEESSGYFLIPEGPLPEGWEKVSAEEGASVWGRGPTSDHDPNATNCQDDKSCPNCNAHNMAQYSVHLMLASLNIVDIPVGYTPPKGPAVEFRVTYNQREWMPLTATRYSNLGPNWSHDYLAFIEEQDDHNNSDSRTTVREHSPGGGWVDHQNDAQTDLYPLDRFGRVLRYDSASDTYDLTFSDGSKRVYGKSDVVQGKRRLLLTREMDAAGNFVEIVYETNSPRILYVNDALGQSTVFNYDSTRTGDPLKITSVSDPFGRTATFDYDQYGRLKKITDTGGMSSSFVYDGNGNSIKVMTTPYGSTTFDSIDNGYRRTLLITDPNTDREYVVSDHTGYVSSAETAYPTILGGLDLSQGSALLVPRNTYYFDKKAMKQFPNPYTYVNYNQATIYHWLHKDFNNAYTSPILESLKKPLESRIWYVYPGQYSSVYDAGITYAAPSFAARLVEDPNGSTTPVSQVWGYEYNAQGRVTKYTDPAGRVTKFEYDAANGRDLKRVLQQVTVNGNTSDEVRAELGDYNTSPYNALHRPAWYRDAAGQTYRFQWNSDGSLKQVTNPKNEVTRLVYDAGGNGYLQRVEQDWLSGTKVTQLAYDGYGRVQTVTDSDNYALNYNYDVFDRVTKVTYPDLTFEQNDYDRLDLVRVTDRAGQRTQITYDNVGHPKTVKDRLNRITQFSWCSCGGLDSMTDPLNHITTWARDIQGRVKDKIYDDGKTTHYAYEQYSGKLKSVTDAKNQVKNFSYNVDGTLKSVSYANAQISSPNVYFNYDTKYRRLATMSDGTGLTIFNYKAIGTLGAGKLDTVVVAGSSLNYTNSYSYDELGRMVTRAVGNVGETVAFDALGRVTSHATSIGTFTPGYVTDTYRLASMTYPNGQTTTYDYFDNAGDRRLKQIWNKKGNAATLSKFDYQYDVLGRIQQWTQQADAATPQVMGLEYDAEDELVNALITPQGGTATKGISYGYDAMGNRTGEQADAFTPSQVSTVSKSTYNNVNQLTVRSGTGPLPVRFEGKANEPVTVDVNNQHAQVSKNPANPPNGRIFSATVSLPIGQNTVQVVAEDYGLAVPPATPGPHGGNVTTKNYSLTVQGGTDRTYAYDDNGNRTASGSTTYEWNAEDRLVAINNGTLRSEFTYDGFGRRVKIVEKNNGTITSTKLFVWAGTQITEERDGNNQVTARFYAEGYIRYVPNAQPIFYTRDHLGSVREVTDNSGNVRARYDYDPYGRVTKVSGDLASDFLFTGHYYHAPSGLHLALYRAYDVDTGRWLNRDPIEEEGGINLYGYVGNNPIEFVDLFGLVDESDGMHEGIVAAGDAFFELLDRISAYLERSKEHTAQQLVDLTGMKPSDAKTILDYAEMGMMSGKGGGKKLGSYSIKCESSMGYVGKGTLERMKASIQRILKKYKDKTTSSKFTPSKPNTSAQAFKDEAQAIRDAGGLPNDKLYNKINSPGEKMLPPLE